ncbi:hypothetical protein QVD17_06469 [Tagetes erecta]|uniref:Uncharacterized protein n=1 Tax=Tagetes erecta TaxID=13708 RepID=A0AAD8P6H6_TARER|nr:hypothetical protein QVD17_06469 [Tagetes erecta]
MTASTAILSRVVARVDKSGIFIDGGGDDDNGLMVVVIMVIVMMVAVIMVVVIELVREEGWGWKIRKKPFYILHPGWSSNGSSAIPDSVAEDVDWNKRRKTRNKSFIRRHEEVVTKKIRKE